jgi:endonuclease G
LYQRFLQYDTDVSFGSSGAPIFNQKWQLVGLHHSTIAKLALDREPEIVGNLGTRMCAIVDFLEKNKENKVQ